MKERVIKTARLFQKVDVGYRETKVRGTEDFLIEKMQVRRK